MIEVPDSDPSADWESFWASLTFEIAGGKPASGAGRPATAGQ
jgi:hypothetical protein